jgi:hemoglobin
VTWRSPAWRQAIRGDVPTLQEWAGGRAAIERTINWFYDRVDRDDLLSPLFLRRASAAHREHVITWWREVFGGPAGYTERLGGYPAMLAYRPHLASRSASGSGSPR